MEGIRLTRVLWHVGDIVRHQQSWFLLLRTRTYVRGPTTMCSCSARLPARGALGTSIVVLLRQ
eukprot:2421079-Prorocentrum_lima.AAC.1